MFLILEGKYLRVEFLDPIIDIHLIFKKSSKLFSKWLYCYACPLTMDENSSCSTSSHHLTMSVFLIFRYSNGCVVVFNYDLNLHVSDGQLCWIFFSCPCWSFVYLIVWGFFLICFKFFCRLLLNYKSSLHILDTSSFSNMSISIYLCVNIYIICVLAYGN